MRIGVISDTHDKLVTIDSAIRFFDDQQVDLIAHCGDWKSVETMRYLAEKAAAYALPVRGVLGNNDLNREGFIQAARYSPGDFEIYDSAYTLPLEDNLYLAAYHGHHKPTLRTLMNDPRCRILLLGHTHKPLITNDAYTLIVNPGSTAFAIPRSKTWQPSVAIVDTVMITADTRYLKVV